VPIAPKSLPVSSPEACQELVHIAYLEKLSGAVNNFLKISELGFLFVNYYVYISLIIKTQTVCLVHK